MGGRRRRWWYSLIFYHQICVCPLSFIFTKRTFRSGERSTNPFKIVLQGSEPILKRIWIPFVMKTGHIHSYPCRDVILLLLRKEPAPGSCSYIASCFLCSWWDNHNDTHMMRFENWVLDWSLRLWVGLGWLCKRREDYAMMGFLRCCVTTKKTVICRVSTVTVTVDTRPTGRVS